MKITFEEEPKKKAGRPKKEEAEAQVEKKRRNYWICGGIMMKLFTSLMPLIPQPYKNIIKFFIKVLNNANSKEELQRIADKFEEITRDGKISTTEWSELGGKNSLGILGNVNKK